MECPKCGSAVKPGDTFCRVCGVDMRTVVRPVSVAVPPDATEGWWAAAGPGAASWTSGPHSWAELVAYVAQGRIGANDVVWHPSLSAWVPAASIPGLIVPTPVPTPVTVPRNRSRRGVVVLSILAVVLVVGAVGAGAYWAWSSGVLGGKRGGGPDLGVAQVTVPDRAKLVQTAAYGEVPANQIGVVLKDGAGRGDAEAVATSLGGSVVGEVEYINAFQIQFPGTTEAQLKKAIATAKAAPGVSLAFPNQQAHNFAEIKGVRVDPYDDSMYGGGVGDGYKAAGVSTAWTYLRGSGIKLSDVHVGIVDEGLYAPGEGAESEFGGDVKLDFPDPAAARLNAPMVSHGKKNAAGSHGTGVATIIGADPNNGGPAGVAGPLGKKLTISMIDYNKGQYGNLVTAADPADPTKAVLADGKTYAMGDLVALKKEIESGARVINCSWGADVCTPDLANAYKTFFQKMAADHPDVTFVCAAGNSGGPLDNRTSFPCGNDFPNMITVGAINNDGTQANYSTTAGDHYVVDLAAPGTGAVVGMNGTRGGAVQQDGTSFSAPHVTAAVAILLSINPKLSAAEVKKILLETARPGITVGEPGSADEHSNLAPAALGGKDLAIDQAVLKVINDMRAQHQPPLEALTPEVLEKMGVIDAVAQTDKPGEYKVRGTLGAVPQDGADVTIDVTGEDHAVGGKTTQHLSAPGDAEWDVTLPKDKGTILVRRLDNGAASLITVESYNINGKWSGSFTVTEVNVTDQEAAKNEGCGPELYGALKGRALPMTMDIQADESGNGSAETLIDVSSLNSNGDNGTTSEPQKFGLTYSGSTVTFDVSGSKGVSSMTGQVSSDGNTLSMKGLLTGGGKGWNIRAVFTLTKPDSQSGG